MLNLEQIDKHPEIVSTTPTRALLRPVDETAPTMMPAVATAAAANQRASVQRTGQCR